MGFSPFAKKKAQEGLSRLLHFGEDSTKKSSMSAHTLDLKRVDCSHEDDFLILNILIYIYFKDYVHVIIKKSTKL